TRMYEEFERARESVDPSRLIDLRYEDLVADPLQAMRSLYERLDLGDFQRVESQLQERLKHHQGYRPNSHPMDAAQEQAILRQWSEYANRYGYAASPTSDDAAPPAAPAPAPRN
ncbi:MAG: sulfotransferase, partial [Planctomycetales bacterium]|nr:sulfotransferase [Planctomycetales bacterium]